MVVKITNRFWKKYFKHKHVKKGVHLIYLEPLSPVLSCGSLVRAGIRDKWLICVAAQPNWNITTKGA